MATRLNSWGKDQAIKSCEELLNNIVRFVEFPGPAGVSVINMWNSKLPEDYRDAQGVFLKYGVSVGGPSVLRFGVEIKGVTYTTIFRVDDLRLNDSDPIPLSTTQHMRPGQPHQILNIIRGPRCGMIQRGVWEAMPITEDYLRHHMGDQSEAVIEWIENTAKMFTELTVSKQVVNEVFRMAKTAGQIKRMVPDLLQYLPTEQRDQFSTATRASTLPFEWAPYPKKQVDDMIIALSKGHLLKGMGKPDTENWGVDNMDRLTWARKAEWANE